MALCPRCVGPWPACDPPHVAVASPRAVRLAALPPEAVAALALERDGQHWNQGTWNAYAEARAEVALARASQAAPCQTVTVDGWGVLPHCPSNIAPRLCVHDEATLRRLRGRE